MNTNKKPTMVIVDDHLIFQQGLKAVISSEKIADVIGVASNGKEFIEVLSDLNPDIVLMDIDMPYMNGIAATQKAIEMLPELKIIALTMFDDEEYYQKMINAGVKGFVLKTTGIGELEKAIEAVLSGDSYFSNELLRRIIKNISHKEESKKYNHSNNLTDREIDVLSEICMGFTTAEIAQKLNISPKTVKSHRSNLLEKTGCKNTPCLIIYAFRNKIVSL